MRVSRSWLGRHAERRETREPRAVIAGEGDPSVSRPTPERCEFGEFGE